MLAELRRNYPGADSQQEISQREEQFLALASEKEVLSSKAFLKFSGEVEKKINSINALLMNDTDCWSEKGKILAAERTVWRELIKNFDIKAIDNALESLRTWFRNKKEQ